MLTLKDLSADKELDRKAMTEVQGGNNGAVLGGQTFTDNSVLDLFSPNVVVKADTVIQLDADFLANVLSPAAVNLS
ncbi:MAG: hypothetical protein WBO73_13715 [Gammaproteobacteria bacterium]